jgi:hypothetical protein
MVIKETTNSQSIGADVNEIFFGYYLTNNWDDFKDSKNIKAELTKRAEKLDADEVDDQKERAKVMANITVRWMKKNGYDGKIVKKWWPKQNSEQISQAIGEDVNLDKNPLDILVKTEKGKFLGLSAKSGKGKGSIPFKNPGLGSIERNLGLDLKQHYTTAEEKMLEEFNNLPTSNTKRKEWFEENIKFYEENIQSSKFVKHVFEKICNDMFDELVNKSQKDLWDYVRENWMDAGYLHPPYIIVTGRGTDGEYTASIDDRKDLDIHDLTIEKVGGDKIRIFSKEKKLLDMRVKFESKQMASSIKFSGE